MKTSLRSFAVFASFARRYRGADLIRRVRRVRNAIRKDFAIIADAMKRSSQRRDNAGCNTDADADAD